MLDGSRRILYEWLEALMFAKRLPIEKTIVEKLKSGKSELYIAFGTLLEFEE